MEDEDKEEDNTGDWERTKADNRRVEEVLRNIDVGRGITTSPANKRMTKEDGTGESTTKKIRKLKHPVLSETWGEEEYNIDPIHLLFPPKNPPPTPPPTTPPIPVHIPSTILSSYTQYTPSYNR